MESIQIYCLTVSYKMLIITGISSEKNKLLFMEYYVETSIIYRQELASLFELQEKLKVHRNF